MRALRCISPRWLLGSLLPVGLLLLLPFLSRADEKTAGEIKPQPVPPAGTLPNEWLKPLTWRCIGPANMGGRITAISVFEADPSTYYLATASGGLLKTINNGVTFEHQFDREQTVSIGDVCVAPSNRDIVWVGTGESNPRNSVSYGNGVYKSIDGGRKWQNMGLTRSFQIGKILVHPSNPDIVYVGALGRLYGANEERGLYKTSDGGKSWTKIHYIDDKTGVIDMRMHPTDPETLLVATYERQRDGYDFNDPVKKWGPGSGLYKTSDGGKTFRKLTKGLPSAILGRIGIDFYRKEPNTVYLVLESEKIGMGQPPRGAAIASLGIQGDDAPKGARLTQVTARGPADQAGLKAEDIVVALGEHKVASYANLTDAIRAHKPGEKVKVQFRRGMDVKEAEVTFGTRTGTGRAGGGGSAERPNAASLGGQQANVQETQGPNSHEYGGIYRSTDAGESWTRINSLNPRPMYFSQIRVDPTDERFLYVLGVQLHRSRNGGKTFTDDGGNGVHADQHALWIDPKDGRHMIVGCDGGTYVTYDRAANWDHLNHMVISQFYHVAVDSRRDYNVYGGLQDNGSWGGPSRTRTQSGPVNEDWIRISGSDGFRCQVDANDPDQVYSASQNGGLYRLNLRTRESATINSAAGGGRGGSRNRWNWNTPFILSHHNSRIYYCAGNYVHRSLDRGKDLRAISPEITATNRGSATALAESPRNPNVLYAGTDDGYLWVTRDGGKEWTNITKNVGLPGNYYVATIEASRYDEGRAYVVFDAHRSDDDNPYVYMTEDFGKTWKSLRGNLPWGSSRCLREDLENPDLLYLGTEFGAWCSLNRGQSWNNLNTNLPTVAVHDFAIHPTAGEIVAATHGRGIWILEVSALRQLKPEAMTDKARLFKPISAVRWQGDPQRGRTNRRFAGQNPANGAALYYSLPVKAGKVTLKVVDADGKLVQEVRTENGPGLHRVTWNLRHAPEGQPGKPRTGTGGGGGQQLGRLAATGTYRVLLNVDGQETSQSLQVIADPSAPASPFSLNEEEEEEEEHVPIDDD